MNTCCICGKEIGADPQAIAVKGKTCPICDDCSALLDVVETMDAKTPASENAVKALKKNMLDNSSSMDVYDAVVDIINAPGQAVAEAEAETEGEPAPVVTHGLKPEEVDDAPESSSIQGLVNFLSKFAVFFLIVGILGSLIIGGIMAGNSATSATGWGIIFGGILASILSFAMIMLLLSVAEAIGRIDQRLENIEKLMESGGKKTRRPSEKKAPARKK